MSLWHWQGNGWKTIPLARSRLGSDAYLLCPGPSLAKADPEWFQCPGVFSLGVNTSYPRFRPSMWIGMDHPSSYDPNLLKESFFKVFRGSDKDSTIASAPVKDAPMTLFADVESVPIESIISRRGHDDKLVFPFNTMLTAIHLLIWMGARKIHIVGADLSGAAAYHDGRTVSTIKQQRNARLHKQIVLQLQTLNNHIKSTLSGVQLISCTDKSPINAFLKHVDLQAALCASGRLATTPESVYRPLPSTADRGVVVGCDSAAEWMLPWWFQNFRKHNPDLPVAVADFGMTDSCRRSAPAGVSVFDVKDVDVPLGWFLKPFALLRSPFAKALWIDLDCEVRGDVSPLLDAIEPDRIVGVVDEGDGLQVHTVNTGVIGVEKTAPVLGRWAEECLERHYSFHSDQDALFATMKTGDLIERGPRWNNIRMMAEVEGCVIRHWTGPKGKDHIMREWSSTEDSRILDGLDVAPSAAILDDSALRVPARHMNPSTARVLGQRIVSTRTFADSLHTVNKLHLGRLSDNTGALEMSAVASLTDSAEDARLIEHRGRVLAFYNRMNAGGVRRMFLSVVDPETLSVGPGIELKCAARQKVEKNWTPFVSDGGVFVLYSIQPMRIMSVDVETGNCLPVAEYARIGWNDAKFGEARGGTPAVEIDAGFLTFFHSSLLKPSTAKLYMMGALLFSKKFPFAPISCTPSPVYHPSMYYGPKMIHSIVFPGGIDVDDGVASVFYGSNDTQCKVARIALDRLLPSMRKVG